MEEKNIIVNNNHYGKCVLKPISNKDNFQSRLQDSKIEINKLNVNLIHNQNVNELGLFEIYAKDMFLGVAGFLCHVEDDKSYPEIYICLLPKHQQNNLSEDVIVSLLEYAFSIKNCDKVYAGIYPNSYSISILKDYGFECITDQRQFNKIKYVLDKRVYALYQMSKIIIQEGENLTPTADMTIENIERTRRLWYLYFKNGVSLSNGGVKKSFLNPQDIISNNNLNLQNFNIYRSDRNSSTAFDQDAIYQFLVEENAINCKVNQQNIYNCFCLGSHEGAMRVLRCLYDPKQNSEIFYSMGGYAFLAAGASTMKPVAYKIHLVPTIDADDGKISLINLINMRKQYPACKMLFLELKTTAGALYTAHELQEIISFCKNEGLFVIFDAAHNNMNFDFNKPLAPVTTLCEQAQYYDYAVIHTGSKTYGLERARIGYITLSKKNSWSDNLHEVIERDLYRVNGSLGDISFETMKLLMETPLKKRQEYLYNNSQQHYFNMNLMLAYLEGINSDKIDSAVRLQIKAEMPMAYWDGIPGMRCVYKPEAGIQMKVDMSAIADKYFFNIKMLNSEIFSYVLNKVAGVVTLHSYQILDPNGTSLRFSFSIKEDVHKGMQAIHDFVTCLDDKPKENKFLFGACTHIAADNTKDGIFSSVKNLQTINRYLKPKL